MKSYRRLFTMLEVGATVCMLLVPQPALAFDQTLSDEAVREAYFLGQDSDRAADFLSSYVQELPVPDTGPDVSQIELRTPYAQVVHVSLHHRSGYSAQRAAADYKQRGDFLLARVQVMFTPTYTGGGADFWRSVSVGLLQKSHMSAQSVSGQPIYATNRDGDNAWIIGANVLVVFAIAGVESDSVQVEAIPPGGSPVHATFDLNALR
jgi:hypothetical protein